MFEGAPDVARILTTASEIASAMEYLHTKVGRLDPMKHHGCQAGAPDDAAHKPAAKRVRGANESGPPSLNLFTVTQRVDDAQGSMHGNLTADSILHPAAKRGRATNGPGPPS